MLKKHQKIALGLFIAVAIFTSMLRGFEPALKGNLVLALFLIPIFFYRVVAFFSGFGFPECFAKDYRSENHPGPYAFFFWLVFLIACAFALFDLRIY